MCPLHSTLARKYYRTMTEILKICDSAVISAARGWIGTPFHHQGRLKNVGVDCLGLLVGIAEELNLCNENGEPLVKHDALDYGHLPDEKRLMGNLKKHCRGARKIKSGLIGLFEIDGTARHLGVFGEQNGYVTLIHAYAPARQVVEHRFDKQWEAKLVKLFRFPANYLSIDSEGGGA